MNILGAFAGLTPLPPRERVVAVARVLHGMPYVWGGNGLPGADCSGFVQMVYAEAGIEPWASRFPRSIDDTALGLWVRMEVIGPDEHPLPGDCAFYGVDRDAGVPDDVHHVVLVTGVAPGGEVTEVTGASRGFRGLTSLDAAVAQGARVRTFPTAKYRSDFCGYRRMPQAA